MKSILLPTDFSEHSRTAIRYAFECFGSEEYQFFLVNAYFMPHAGAVMMTSIEDVMQESATKEMDTLVLELEKQFPQYKSRMSHEVVHGDPNMVIKNIVEERNVEMIIMGTTGASGLKAALIGTVTAQVVKNAKCTVLAVPHNAKIEKPKRIALAMDDRELDENTLSNLKETLDNLNARVLIFNVHTQGESVSIQEARTGIQLHRALDGIEHEFLPAMDETIEQGILNFVEERQCDMLIMVHHHYAALEGFFHKSVSKQVSMHSPIPLLVLKEQDHA